MTLFEAMKLTDIYESMVSSGEKKKNMTLW